MADRYAATGNQAAVTASPGDTALTVLATTLTRAKIYELIFSQGGTPADNVIEWLVRRFSAVGTEGAGVTPTPLDADAPAAQLDAGEDHSAEPTYTAATELLDFDLNQRATFRFVAAPGGEFIVPATASAGIGMTPISSGYSGIANVSAHWEE
jgi:hypothetical protein